MKTSSIVDQFREEGYAIVRQLFNGDDVLRLQRETADLYQAGIQHPVTYKHGNLAYEILPEKHFDQRYIINHLGRIPEEKESFIIDKLSFEILRKKSNDLLLIKLKKHRGK